jgi:Holliday junction resolvase
MVTMYQRGAALERAIADKLRALDYFVIRSSASKTPVDLVAIRQNEVLLIQCRRSLRLDPGEWNELWDVATATGGTPLVAGIQNRKTVYRLMTGPKTARGPQPWKPWTPPSYLRPVFVEYSDGLLTPEEARLRAGAGGTGH